MGVLNRCVGAVMLTQLEQRAVARAQAPPVKVEPEAQAPPPPKTGPVQLVLPAYSTTWS